MACDLQCLERLDKRIKGMLQVLEVGLVINDTFKALYLKVIREGNTNLSQYTSLEQGLIIMLPINY